MTFKTPGAQNAIALVLYCLWKTRVLSLNFMTNLFLYCVDTLFWLNHAITVNSSLNAIVWWTSIIFNAMYKNKSKYDDKKKNVILKLSNNRQFFFALYHLLLLSSNALVHLLFVQKNIRHFSFIGASTRLRKWPWQRKKKMFTITFWQPIHSFLTRTWFVQYLHNLLNVYIQKQFIYMAGCHLLLKANFQYQANNSSILGKTSKKETFMYGYYFCRKQILRQSQSCQFFSPFCFLSSISQFCISVSIL